MRIYKLIYGRDFIILNDAVYFKEVSNNYTYECDICSLHDNICANITNLMVSSKLCESKVHKVLESGPVYTVDNKGTAYKIKSHLLNGSFISSNAVFTTSISNHKLSIFEVEVIKLNLYEYSGKKCK